MHQVRDRLHLHLDVGRCAPSNNYNRDGGLHLHVLPGYRHRDHVNGDGEHRDRLQGLYYLPESDRHIRRQKRYRGQLLRHHRFGLQRVCIPLLDVGASFRPVWQPRIPQISRGMLPGGFCSELRGLGFDRPGWLRHTPSMFMRPAGKRGLELRRLEFWSCFGARLCGRWTEWHAFSGVPQLLLLLGIISDWSTLWIRAT